MDGLQLQILIDLHKHAVRQGPGGEAETKQALELAGFDRSRHLKIADIGCGTGASTILLAKELDAEITAVDFLPEFLAELETRAKDHGVAEKINTLSCSMEALPFSDEEFEVIWSEGAIYRIENYYRPMQSRFDAVLERHGQSDKARAIVEAEKKEIALYEKYRDYYSYGVYIAKKI